MNGTAHFSLWCFALLVIFSTITSSGAHDWGVVESISVVDYGIYKKRGVSAIKIRHTQETLRVAAQKKAIFGFRYRVKTVGPEDCAEVAIIKLVPQNDTFYMPHPFWETIWTFDEKERLFARRQRVCEDRIYSLFIYFRHNSKPTPGRYSLALMNSNDEILLEKHFEIYKN